MLTQQRAKEVFYYDPVTGELYWKVNKGSVKKGTKIKGVDNNGYKQVSVDGFIYYTHRVVWLINYGAWPKLIDHINHNPGDNRLENLRECTHVENATNRSLNKNNSSGYHGVCWCNFTSRWQAYIWIDGKQKKKRFDTLEEAVSFRRSLEKENGYHENHGS